MIATVSTFLVVGFVVGGMTLWLLDGLARGDDKHDQINALFGRFLLAVLVGISVAAATIFLL